MYTTLHVIIIVDNFIPANCQCVEKTHYAISKQQTYHCKWTWNYYIHLVKQTFAPKTSAFCDEFILFGCQNCLSSVSGAHGL